MINASKINAAKQYLRMAGDALHHATDDENTSRYIVLAYHKEIASQGEKWLEEMAKRFDK